MKKLTLTFVTSLLAIVCAASAESSTDSTTVKRDSARMVRVAEKPKAPAERLIYTDFWRVKRQIDLSFQRLKSVSQAAMQCHMSLDRVNRLFKRYAHEDAEHYLANLRRNSTSAALPQDAELAARQRTTSWPDPYIIGR